MTPDPIAAIRERHRLTVGQYQLSPAELDRGELLAEVDRLTARLEAAEAAPEVNQAMWLGLCDEYRGSLNHHRGLLRALRQHKNLTEYQRLEIDLVLDPDGTDTTLDIAPSEASAPSPATVELDE